jgi:hypothetical protein
MTTKTKEPTFEELHSDKSSSELMALIGETTDKREKATLSKLLRFQLRKEEQEIKDELKQAAEDSKEEKRLLKKTQIDFMEARKAYLASYREMNAIINGKSMLKHLPDFSEKCADFKEKSAAFIASMDEHLSNLAAVKRSLNAEPKEDEQTND